MNVFIFEVSIQQFVVVNYKNRNKIIDNPIKKLTWIHLQSPASILSTTYVG
jgi:hypothetical protein